MAVSERSTRLVEYFASLKKTYGNKKDEAVKELEELYKESSFLKELCIQNKDYLKSEYKLDLDDFKIFGGTKYSDEHLLASAKYKLVNKCGEEGFEILTELYNVYRFAQTLNKQKELNNTINIANKILALSRNEYLEFMRVYFYKVHEKMVLDGYGYAFGQRIGFVCINRVKNNGKRKLIDFAKTKKRKAEFLAEGKKLWNEKDALKAKENGVEYDGVDYRVYKEAEYNYEICLIDNRLPNATQFEFISADTRRLECRDKSNEELLEMCEYKPENIVKLNCDLKTKVTLCIQADDLLYTKFIRNANQESYKAGKASWKN